LSYRDEPTVQLPMLNTIPQPIHPTRDFFVFILTPPSYLNKYAALLARHSLNRGGSWQESCERT